MQGQQATKQRDVAVILRQRQGVRFLRKLLQLTGVWATSYATKDPLATAYNEGRRAVGLYILQQVQWQAPEMIDALLGWSDKQPQHAREEQYDDE